VKHSISLVSFRAVAKNTLVGFATIRIDQIRLVVHDVALHVKGASRWAQLPARPEVRDGALVIGDDGKVQYSITLEFEGGRAVRDAFSAAVWAAVITRHPELEMEAVP
jgi:hypothetical protein